MSDEAIKKRQARAKELVVVSMPKVKILPNVNIDPIFKNGWDDMCYRINPKHPERAARWINNSVINSRKYFMKKYGHPNSTPDEFKELVDKVRKQCKFSRFIRRILSYARCQLL